MRAVLSLVILLGGAGTAAADRPTWSAHAGVTQRWLTSPSAVTLTEANLVGWELTAERHATRVALPGPLPALDVVAAIGFGAGDVDGTTFDQLANHVSTWQLTAGARARLPLRPWLHLQARAGVGGGKTSTRIADDTMPDVAIADDGRTLVASTGAGLAIVPRLGRSAWWGVEAEVGYHAATATEVRAGPEDRAAPELTIPAAYASLGELDLDGYTLTIAFTVGF